MNEASKESGSKAGPLGFVAGGIAAGIKRSGAADLGMIVCERPAVVAGVTTRNLICGAPVTVTRERLAASHFARGVIVNSGCSNVCTGPEGIADARRMAEIAEQAAGAGAGEFLVASTGVIGVPLPMKKIHDGTPKLAASLTADGWGRFAESILTTDLVAKIARRTLRVGREMQVEAVVLGVAKGSGMIEPNMATMLAFIATDYPVEGAAARGLMSEVTGRTFNCVTVDGDTSTSDMAILLASGLAAGRDELAEGDDAAFARALEEVCAELAIAIARDGEGAQHLVTIDVAGAADEAAARRIAKTIANSPLVKTAIFGRDPNWGRITAAAGRAGVPFDPQQVSLRLQGREIFREGRPMPHEKKELIEALGRPEVGIELTVGDGPGRARVWTCDFTYDYVKINAEYTT